MSLPTIDAPQRIAAMWQGLVDAIDGVGTIAAPCARPAIPATEPEPVAVPFDLEADVTREA